MVARQRGHVGYPIPPPVRQASIDKLLIGTLVLGCAATVTLFAGIPTVHALKGWFWKPWPKVLDLGVLAAGGVAVAMLVWAAHRWRARRAVSVGLLVAVAVLQQFTFALAEGRGLAGLRDRALHTGHSEYVRLASSGISLRDVLCDYETLVQGGRLPFCAVKPPGQLLTYALSARLADVVVGQGLLERSPVFGVTTEAHRRVVELITWLWPWLAALALVPIAMLACWRLGAAWFWPVAWFALSAPFALVTLHLDQVLFPGLSALLIWMAVTGRWVWGGVLAWLAAFVSFGLLPAIVLAGALAVLTQPAAQRWRLVRHGAPRFALGCAVVAATHIALTGYDPVLRYQRAIAAHEQWKHWESSWTHSLAAARMNLIEFLWWANPAFLVPALVVAIGTFRRWRARQLDDHDRFGLAFAAVLMLVAGIGRTWAETARLWLFMLPLALLAVARPLLQRGTTACALVAMLQWAWVLAIKATQDFR